MRKCLICVQVLWPIYRYVFKYDGQYTGMCSSVMANIQVYTQVWCPIYRYVFKCDGQYTGMCTSVMTNKHVCVQV